MEWGALGHAVVAMRLCDVIAHYILKKWWGLVYLQEGACCLLSGCLTPVLRRRIVLSEFRFRYPVSSVLRSISSVSKCQVSSGQSVQFSKFSKFSKFRKAQVNQFSQQMPGKFSSSKQMPGQLVLRLIRSISPVQ